MSETITIKGEKAGLTLQELSGFVDRARQLEDAGRQLLKLKGTVTIGGTLREITGEFE